jgi:hypothetical protein
MTTIRYTEDEATSRRHAKAGGHANRRARRTGVGDQRAVRGGRDKSVRIGATRVGKGVFARRRYAPQAVIGEIEGQEIDDPHYGSEYCMNIGANRVLEPAAPFRFVNHSCEPNCEFDFFDLPDAGQTTLRRRVFLMALREIKPGEELTIDYNWSAASAIACRCQAPSCRGWIVDPDELDVLLARLDAEAAARAAYETPNV